MSKASPSARRRSRAPVSWASGPLQRVAPGPQVASRPMPEPRAGDALIIFGITGDLARKMTFRSLYRLERRGLLSCPIVGVAIDDWTVDHLRQHARQSIEATGERVDGKVFKRLAKRFSYVSGDFSDTALYERVLDELAFAATPVFSLEIP